VRINLQVLIKLIRIERKKKTKIFTLIIFYRHMGPKSKVEIIKDTGHAVNMDAPISLNALITSFVLDYDQCDRK
jgi:hypothetical protein